MPSRMSLGRVVLAWLQIANIAWFRTALARESDAAKRRELEKRLAEVEAVVRSHLFGTPAAQA